MKTTLTVRLDERQARALVELARRLGCSASDIVREALDAAMAERSIAERARPYEGRLKLTPTAEPDLRAQLRQRNWRP